MDAGWLSEIFVLVSGRRRARRRKSTWFVRFAGCNIRCAYCDTPDSLVRVPACEIHLADGARERLANPLSAAELASVVAKFCAEDPASR
jgi:organic radical activating enzyme